MYLKIILFAILFANNVQAQFIKSTKNGILEYSYKDLQLNKLYRYRTSKPDTIILSQSQDSSLYLSPLINREFPLWLVKNNTRLKMFSLEEKRYSLSKLRVGYYELRYQDDITTKPLKIYLNIIK